MRVLTLLFLVSCWCVYANAEPSCAFCPAQYCQNAALAEQLKANKRRAAEVRGLPHRLSVLFDQLGDCQACVEQAPDWPHLVLEYDGAALTAHYGRETSSYVTSREWSAADEYRARQDMRSGLVSRFHITLGSEPCRCCTAQSVDGYRSWVKSSSYDALLNDPKWNDQLRVHETQTISITTPEQAQETPSDLSDIPPNLRMTEPVLGALDDFKAPPPARFVQVLCQSCQPLADSYNEIGTQMNNLIEVIASVQRDISYEQKMVDYSRAMTDALNAVAATPEVIAKHKTHSDRLQLALERLPQLQRQATQLNAQMQQLRTEQTAVMDELRACESTQCLPKDVDAPKIDFPTVSIMVPATDDAPSVPVMPNTPAEIQWPDDEPEPRENLPPLELYHLGEIFFGVHINEECPAAVSTIYLASNNGHPLLVGDLLEEGKIADVLDHTVRGNNTPNPIIESEYNCGNKRTGTQKGTLKTTVTDKVTGESLEVVVPAQGKTLKPLRLSSDPNSEATWNAKGHYMEHEAWQPISTKCLPCMQLVAQYNETMERVFDTRVREASLRANLALFKKGGAGSMDWNKKDSAKVIKFFLSAIENLEKHLEFEKSLLQELEQQASYLQKVIQDCERQQCTKKEHTKIIPIKIPGLKKGEYFQPNVSAILNEHGFNWTGPYTTDCQPCQPIVQQLNAVPGWLTRAHHKLAWYEAELKRFEINGAVESGNSPLAEARATILQTIQADVAKARQEIAALKKLMQKLQADLALCQAKYCSGDAKTPRIGLGTDIQKNGGVLIGNYTKCEEEGESLTNPITVGPNNEVGSSANFKEKAKSKVVGAAVGALAGLVGIGGGGGGADDGPPTYKDPIKSRAKTKVKTKNPTREIRVGGGFTDQGLLISTDIKSAPGKGTVHSVVLQNAAGWQLYPESIYLYEIWGEWKLTVSWTRDTYVDGEHVKHEEGGWNESWKELIAKGEYVNYVEVQQAPLWEQLGFNTATSGARSLGTLFPVTPSMLANGPLDLFVHITEPKEDPVVTVPYHFRLSLDDKGRVVTEHVDTENETQPAQCKNRTIVSSDFITENNVATPDDAQTETITEATTNTVEEKTEEAQEIQEASIISDEQVDNIIKDSAQFGRRLTPEEIAKLKTKPTKNDIDGDGIQNEIDTMPSIPSDSFISGSTIGRVLDPAGQTVNVQGSGGGSADGVSVEVGNEKDGSNPRIEILGVELELSPGTIFDASFG